MVVARRGETRSPDDHGGGPDKSAGSWTNHHEQSLALSGNTLLHVLKKCQPEYSRLKCAVDAILLSCVQFRQSCCLYLRLERGKHPFHNRSYKKEERGQENICQLTSQRSQEVNGLFRQAWIHF